MLIYTILYFFYKIHVCRGCLVPTTTVHGVVSRNLRNLDLTSELFKDRSGRGSKCLSIQASGAVSIVLMRDLEPPSFGSKIDPYYRL